MKKRQRQRRLWSGFPICQIERVEEDIGRIKRRATLLIVPSMKLSLSWSRLTSEIRTRRWNGLLAQVINVPPAPYRLRTDQGPINESRHNIPSDSFDCRPLLLALPVFPRKLMIYITIHKTHKYATWCNMSLH